MVQTMYLLFLVLAAWYRFLSSVWIVLLLVFISGIVAGVLYVNVVTFFRNLFQKRYMEFAMGYSAVACGGGMLTAISSPEKSRNNTREKIKYFFTYV